LALGRAARACIKLLEGLSWKACNIL